MKNLVTTILILFSIPGFALPLCETSCEVSISFPDGGVIEATDTVTFTFGIGAELLLGDSGTINTAIQPANTNFSAGGELILLAGESISFGSNGSFYLGTAGNIDTSLFQVNSSGDMTVKANGDVPKITLNGNLDLAGALTLEAHEILVTGNLTVGSLVIDTNSGASSNLSNPGLELNSNILIESNAIFSVGTVLTGTGELTFETPGIITIGNSSILSSG